MELAINQYFWCQSPCMNRHIAHLTSRFDNATEGIILTDTKGSIILINPSARRMFQYEEDEIIGKSVEILIPRPQQQHHVKLREQFVEHPSNRRMGHGRDLYAMKKNGEWLAVEVSLSHYERDGEMFVIAFIVDITQRKKIEQAMLDQQHKLEHITDQVKKLNTELEAKVEERTLILREALEKLQSSQQELSEALAKEKELNEIKGRFVSMASHEFRTPLSTVLSSASLLSKYTNTEDQDKRQRHINKIKNSVSQLNEILEDFLSLGKLDEGKVECNPSVFNLEEFLHELVEETSGLLKKGQKISLDFKGNPEVSADRKLLKNALVNLVTNAIKFSDEDKTVEVRASVESDQAEIKVSDQGIGISKEDQVHLFSSFFRGANAVNIQGTGLGLHIVKRFTELMHGKVEIDSDINQGTTVTITIPITR